MKQDIDELAGQIALRYVNNYGETTEQYPANPNGSPQGITGLTANDGRVTIMMPHPERVFRAVQNSWAPDHWDEDGAWMRMFRNARVWCEEKLRLFIKSFGRQNPRSCERSRVFSLRSLE